MKRWWRRCAKQTLGMSLIINFFKKYIKIIFYLFILILNISIFKLYKKIHLKHINVMYFL
jgi:hypothetical protein